MGKSGIADTIGYTGTEIAVACGDGAREVRVVGRVFGSLAPEALRRLVESA